MSEGKEKMKQNGLNKKSVSEIFRKYFMFVALIVVWAIFAGISDGTFLSARNLSNLFRQVTFMAFLSIGMLNVIILGEIDLSVGSIAGLSGGLFAMMTCWWGVPLWIGLIIALLIGFGLGVWNGVWIAYLGVPSFIVTLAGQLIFRGVLVGISEGQTVAPMDSALKWIGSGTINKTVGIIIGVALSLILVVMIVRKGMRSMKEGGMGTSKMNTIVRCVVAVVVSMGFISIMNSYNGTPSAILFVALLFVVFYFISQKTVFGRRVYAIGGNKAASVLAGINVKKNILIVFGLNGLMASAAAIFLSARLNSAATSAGENGELDAIAACVIGGASLMGGIGSLPGVLVGALIMVSIDNGTALLNIQSFWQTIIKGFVLLLAVWIDMSKKKNN